MKRRASILVDSKPMKIQKTSGQLAITQEVARQLKKKIPPTERRYFTTNASGPVMSLTSTVGTWAGSGVNPAAESIFFPSQGDDINNRQGRSTRVVKIQVRGTLKIEPETDVAANYTPYIRLIVYRAVQAQGLVPLPAELMSDNGIYAFRDLDHLPKFVILHDENFLPNSAQGADSVGATRNTNGYDIPFKITIKKAFDVKFNNNLSSTSNYTSIEENNISMCACKSDSTSVVTLNYCSRVTFIDN